jgi:hypothetical protein
MVEIQARLCDFALSLPGRLGRFPLGRARRQVDKKVFVGTSTDRIRARARRWVDVPVQADGVTPGLLCDWIEKLPHRRAERLVAELERHALPWAPGVGRTGSVP